MHSYTLTLLCTHPPIHSHFLAYTPVRTHTPIHSHSCVHTYKHTCVHTHSSTLMFLCVHTHPYKLPCAHTHVCTHSPAFLKYSVTLSGRSSHCHRHPHPGTGTHVHSGHTLPDSPAAAKGSSEELPHLTENKSTAEPTRSHTHSRPSTPPNTRRCPSPRRDSPADIWDECSLCLFSPFI